MDTICELNARKIDGVILRALAASKLTTAASESGVSLTRLSRWKSNQGEGGALHLEETSNVLAVLGLAVIDVSDRDVVSIPRVEYEALRALVRQSLG